MTLFNKKNINIATLFLSVAMFVCCSQDKNSEENQDLIYKFPQGVVENFELIHTDSTKVKAIMKGEKYNDFSSQKFPYAEFPSGLKVDFFSNNNEKTTLIANYGIYYYNTNLAEFRDSVKIVTYEGKILKSDKLFWNERLNWVFTDGKFTYIDSLQKSVTRGVGMDFNNNFSKLTARKVTGVLPLKE